MNTYGLDTERLVRFVNSMPTTTSILVWINQLRDTIGSLFDDVDRVSINVNIMCPLDRVPANETADNEKRSSAPVESEPAIDPSRLRPLQNGAAVHATIRNGPSPSERLVEEFQRQGFPIDEYHPAHMVDYYYSPDVYVGSILLWRKKELPPISAESRARLELLRPFIVFVLSYIVPK